MIIRQPRAEDGDALVEMGRRMHGEGAYSFLPYDAEKLRRLMLTIIKEPETYCGLVTEAGGSLVGMFGGYLTDYFFCEERLACDLLLFVEREHRGSSAALRMIRAFSRWAAERGAREVCLGVSTNINAERTGEFYERMGFARVGGLYKQRLS